MKIPVPELYVFYDGKDAAPEEGLEKGRENEKRKIATNSRNPAYLSTL